MADLHLDPKENARTVADLPCPSGLPLPGNLFQMAPAKLRLVLSDGRNPTVRRSESDSAPYR